MQERLLELDKEKIKSLQLEWGFQTRFAKKIGVKKQTVNAWFLGSKRISETRLAMLCFEIHCEAHDILTKESSDFLNNLSLRG